MSMVLICLVAQLGLPPLLSLNLLGIPLLDLTREFCFLTLFHNQSSQLVGMWQSEQNQFCHEYVYLLFSAGRKRYSRLINRLTRTVEHYKQRKPCVYLVDYFAIVKLNKIRWEISRYFSWLDHFCWNISPSKIMKSKMENILRNIREALWGPIDVQFGRIWSKPQTIFLWI